MHNAFGKKRWASSVLLSLKKFMWVIENHLVANLLGFSQLNLPCLVIPTNLLVNSVLHKGKLWGRVKCTIKFLVGLVLNYSCLCLIWNHSISLSLAFSQEKQRALQSDKNCPISGCTSLSYAERAAKMNIWLHYHLSVPLLHLLFLLHPLFSCIHSQFLFLHTYEFTLSPVIIATRNT